MIDRSRQRRCAVCDVPLGIQARFDQVFCGKKCRKRGRNQQYKQNLAERGLPRNGPVDPEIRAEWQLRRHGES